MKRKRTRSGTIATTSRKSNRHHGFGSRFLAALGIFAGVELVVGLSDAGWYLWVEGGLPHPIFGAVALGVYLAFGLVAGTLVGLGAAAAVATERGAATIGAAAALFLSFGALAFFRWLPEAVEIGTALGMLALGLLACGSILGGGALGALAEWIGFRALRRGLLALVLLSAGAATLPLLRLGGSDPFAELSPRPGEGPNVLLIVIDTLRADRIGAHGNPDRLTPAIDALADEGVVFRQAISTSCFTPPPHASLLTGTYPVRHGITGAEQFLADANLTLAEILGARGYATFGVVSNLFLAKVFGWEQGFHLYDDSLVAGSSPGIWLERTPAVALMAKVGLTPRRWLLLAAHGTGLLEPVNAKATIDHVLAALDAVGERPFFGFVNIMDPHYPYGPRGAGAGGEAARANAEVTPVLRATGHPLGAVDHGRELAATLLGLYDAEVRYTDRELARLFAELRRRGKLDNTLVIVTADHGEHFGEHDLLFHANSLYRELVHVPLVIRPPGEQADAARGKTHEQAVSLVDVAATVLDLLQVPPPPTLHGRSLLPILTDREGEAPERIAVSEWQDRRALVWGGYKAFFSGDELERVVRRSPSGDPAEAEDLAAADPALRQAAIDRYQRWLERCASSGSLAEEGAAIDPGIAEQLRALGYLN